MRSIVAGRLSTAHTQLPGRVEAQALARKLTGRMDITAPTVGRQGSR